jgi:hypothetical protein
MSPRGGGGGSKKCHVLFEWPLRNAASGSITQTQETVPDSQHHKRGALQSLEFQRMPKRSAEKVSRNLT